MTATDQPRCVICGAAGPLQGQTCADRHRNMLYVYPNGGIWGGWTQHGDVRPCWAELENRRARERRARGRRPRECQACGEAFTPKRNDAKHCSAACRQRAYRRRVTTNDSTTVGPSLSVTADVTGGRP